MSFQEAEIGVSGLAYYRNGHDKRPPGNPLGGWIDLFTENHDMGIRQLGDMWDLHAITSVRQNPSERVSLYSIQVILEGVSELGIASQEELDILADSVSQTIWQRVEAKGDVYDRIPPTIARHKQQQSETVTYTDKLLASDLGIHPSRVRHARLALEIDYPLYGQICADKIKKYLEKKNSEQILPEGFAAVLADEANIGTRTFISELATKTGISRNKAKSIKSGRNPSPEEFGIMLESFDLNETQVEQLVELWVDGFRNSITLESLGKELGVNKERVRQLAAGIGIGGNRRSLIWDEIEAVRKYRNEQKSRNASTKIAKKQPKRIINARRQNIRRSRVTKPGLVGSQKDFIINGISLQEDVPVEIRSDYPNVLTPDYLNSLISLEKSAVKLLAGSSILNPVIITGEQKKAIEFLIREGIYPPGARIRRSYVNGSHEDMYYFEYS